MTVVATETETFESTLRLAQQGDHDAFAEVVDEHQSMVFSIALRFFNDRDRAEELAQDVFVQLYRSLGEISSPSHLIFWLRQVTIRRCIDQKRRFRLRLVTLDGAEPVAVDAHDDPLLRRKLQRMIADLPEPQRLAITLRYQEELEPADISRILRMPLKTVKSHLYRGLRALRTRLRDC